MISIGFLNTLLFTIYLTTTDLPGGEVGMAPFVIAIESLIAIFFSSVIYLLVRIKNDISLIKTVLIYQIVHFLILMISGVNPFNKEMSEGLRNLSFWTYLISFFVTLSLVAILRLIKDPKPANQ